MRILVVGPEFGVNESGEYRPGGIAQFSRCLVRAIAQSPKVTRVGIMSLLDSDAAMKKTMTRYAQQDASPNIEILSHGFQGNKAAMALSLVTQQFKYDHVMFLHVGVGLLANFIINRETSFWLVGIEVRRRLTAMERRAYLRANTRLSISTYSSQEMQRYNPDLPAAQTVHLCVEPDQAWVEPAQDETEAMAAYHPQDRKPAVLVVARMSASECYKGHDQLIEAWPTVVAEKSDAELWIVGGGDDVERLQKKAAALAPEVTSKVIFRGKISHEDLLTSYQEASVFAMPSTGEGFGLVFCEAMRFGMPCICSFDSAAEIVLNDETGFVVSQTPDDIAKACVRLLNDPDLASSMAQKGQERFESVFTFAAYKKRLLRAMNID